MAFTSYRPGRAALLMESLSKAPLGRWSCAYLVLLCAGCGQGMPVAPVSGTVTYQGQPLVGASITTQPIAADSVHPGPGSFGRTDEQGNFELELVKPAIKGAIIGEHRVMISQPSTGQAGDDAFQVDDPDAHRAGAATSIWPARFTDGSLRLVVPQEGTIDARFDLTP